MSSEKPIFLYPLAFSGKRNFPRRCELSKNPAISLGNLLFGVEPSGGNPPAKASTPANN